jgi:hypothetical protein
MAFLAVCKHLAYIRDFTIEVIRDKVLMFDYQLNESDYNSFLNTKMISHPELEGFSSSTLKKAKQVMYRILEQSGIINNPKEKKILHQILLQDVVKAIRIDNPEWFKIFMISDIEIKELSK